MQQVALAHDPNELALIVNDGHGTDPVFDENLGDVFYRRGWFNGDNRGNHYVTGFHALLLPGLHRPMLIRV
jgi:hypothetical protein